MVKVEYSGIPNVYLGLQVVVMALHAATPRMMNGYSMQFEVQSATTSCFFKPRFVKALANLMLAL